MEMPLSGLCWVMEHSGGSPAAKNRGIEDCCCNAVSERAFPNKVATGAQMRWIKSVAL